MLDKKSICWPNSIFISQNYFWNILERLFYHSLFELLRYLWVAAWICSMDCNMLISNFSTLSKNSGVTQVLIRRRKKDRNCLIPIFCQLLKCFWNSLCCTTYNKHDWKCFFHSFTDGSTHHSAAHIRITKTTFM